MDSTLICSPVKNHGNLGIVPQAVDINSGFYFFNEITFSFKFKSCINKRKQMCLKSVRLDKCSLDGPDGLWEERTLRTCEGKVCGLTVQAQDTHGI